MSRLIPSIEYLLECSLSSLGEMELCCLNRSQQCLRAAKEEMDEAIAQREAAGVARWVREHRAELLEAAKTAGVIDISKRGKKVMNAPSSDA